MDEQTLLSLIEAEEAAIDDTQLQADRDKAIDYFHGRAVGRIAAPEIPGRSDYVSRDVADTIDWIMPGLMKTFMGNDEAMQFTPRGAEDEDQAKQESDYVNYIVNEKNNAYEVFSTWFDDALLQKNGYVVAYWKTDKSVQEGQYSGLGAEELALLMQDDDVEIVKAQETIDGIDEAGIPIVKYDVTLRRVDDRSSICIENIPPSMAKVSWRHRNVRLGDAHYCGYDDYKTISELRESGFSVDDDISDDYGAHDYRDKEIAGYRNRQLFERDSDDPASRVVKIRYRWLRVDFDGDGIAELRYLMMVGKTILVNEKTDIVQMACLTPRIIAHNHIGRSIEEVVEDLVELKTSLTRGLIDNVKLANNGRHVVDKNTVNLDDMLVARPGGLVRNDGPPGASVMPLTHPMLGAPVMEALQMIDSVRENRTGVTKYNMGTDAGSLNKTATGVAIINDAANQRIEWIARTFAETGVKEIYRIVHALTLKHQDKEDVVKLRNQWVTVKPTEWFRRHDMTISVGLGSTNRTMQMQGLSQIALMQEKAFQAGVVTPENVYNLASDSVKALGFKNSDKYFTHPDKVPAKQPQPDPRMEKIKLDGYNAEQDRQLERDKLGLQENQQQFDQQKDTLNMVSNMAPMMTGF